LLVVGGVLVAKGNNVAGIACDLLGAVFIWGAFRTFRGD
jgi:hypothetical protein